MVVAAGRNEGRLVAVLLHHLEAEDVTVERERALDVAHLQVNVADIHSRVDRHPCATLPGRLRSRPVPRGRRPSRDRRSRPSEPRGRAPPRKHPPRRLPPTSASGDRKSTRLNSSHVKTSYAVFCLKTK